VPETRYARSGDDHIAYQTLGNGPPDLVFTVKDLVTGSDLAFVDRGRHQLKGVPQEWQIYAVQ